MKYAWCCLLLIFIPQVVSGTSVRGRVNFGGYLATERFTNSDWGSNKNDFEVLSSEFYLKAIGIENTRWEGTADLRDTNDFFDKPDTEKLQLNAKNSFQAQELDAKYATSRYSVTLGRFHVQDAGVDGVDGARFELKHSASWSSGIFSGLNAKTVDQTYYQVNSDTNVTGASTTYQRPMTDWDKSFFITNGLVTTSQDEYLDRFYLFHNSVYQWSPKNRLISLVYFDFLPRPFIQNGNITWQEGWNDRWSSQVNLLAIDVITYSHRESVREQLIPSAYKEANCKVDFTPSALSKYELGLSDGVRAADGLTRKEYYLGYEQNKFFSDHLAAFLRAGGRNNFTSNDLFSHLYLGYFSRRNELSLDAEYGMQHYTTDGLVKHPLTVELTYSRYISREWYGTLTVERDADESVQILSGFFRIGYRFGSMETPPLRDLPPAKGQL